MAYVAPERNRGGGPVGATLGYGLDSMPAATFAGERGRKSRNR